MRRGVVCRALAVGFIGTFGGSASGGFQLISQSHVVDAERRETTFMLEFSESPKFDRPVGSAGPSSVIEANSFQLFYGSNLDGPDVLGEDVVVLRGPEIRFDNDLRIRDTLGMDDAPPAGGFGPVRGSVPITVDDEAVTFTVPWELLGETDTNYRFTIEAYERGELTSSVSVAAPLPPALWPAMVVLGGIVAGGVTHKRLKKRA